jgi:hypothetical protein
MSAKAMSTGVVIDHRDGPQAIASGQVIARPQAAVDQDSGRLRILGQSIDNSQRGIEQLDHMAILGAHDGAPRHEFDRSVEVLGE